jgi:hypothetical protein
VSCPVLRANYGGQQKRAEFGHRVFPLREAAAPGRLLFSKLRQPEIANLGQSEAFDGAPTRRKRSGHFPIFPPDALAVILQKFAEQRLPLFLRRRTALLERAIFVAAGDRQGMEFETRAKFDQTIPYDARRWMKDLTLVCDKERHDTLSAAFQSRQADPPPRPAAN